MAFGRSTVDTTKRIKNAVLEDQLFRDHYGSEEKTNQNWKKSWSWILNEYEALHQKTSQVSKHADFMSDVHQKLREKDKRTIVPIPDTTNHEYGWISNLPDFKLEKFGEDYHRAIPLPKEFHIFKGF